LLGIEQGATENSTVCIELLQNLIDKGLDPARRVSLHPGWLKGIKKGCNEGIRKKRSSAEMY
jgi:hypothetical protein